MTVRLRRFDAADYLNSEEDIAAYIADIAQDGDPALLASALGDVSRARGMSRLSRETGISRMGLTKALSADGNPSFATISKVAKALGLRVTLVPVDGKN